MRKEISGTTVQPTLSHDVTKIWTKDLDGCSGWINIYLVLVKSKKKSKCLLTLTRP